MLELSNESGYGMVENRIRRQIRCSRLFWFTWCFTNVRSRLRNSIVPFILRIWNVVWFIWMMCIRVHTRSTDLKFPSTMKFKLVCTREWCILRVRLNKFMGLIPRPRAQDLEQAFRNGVIEEKVLPMEKRQYSEAISNCLSQCKFQDNPVDLAKIGWYSSSNTAQRVTCGFDLDRNKKMLIDFFYGLFRE